MVIIHLCRIKKLLKKQPQIHKQQLLWGISATLISVGGTAQQGISKPGGLWNVLMVGNVQLEGSLGGV